MSVETNVYVFLISLFISTSYIIAFNQHTNIFYYFVVNNFGPITFSTSLKYSWNVDYKSLKFM